MFRTINTSIPLDGSDKSGFNVCVKGGLYELFGSKAKRRATRYAKGFDYLALLMSRFVLGSKQTPFTNSEEKDIQHLSKRYMPDKVKQDTIGAALTEGTLLANYRFDRYKSKKDDDDTGRPESLEIVSTEDIGQAVTEAAIVCECQNAARDLQNVPANDLTPSDLAEYATKRASETEGLDAQVLIQNLVVLEIRR